MTMTITSPHHLPLLLTLLLLLQVQLSHAFIPPKPGSDLEKTYEPVHTYRRRLNITYGYHPTHMHAEMCRYLTEAECQDADESMQRHQQRHRDLQIKFHQDRQRRLAQHDQQQQDNRNLRGTTSMEEPEEMEYHLAEFQRILAKATDYFSNEWQQPTREEEKEELERLLEWDRQQQFAKRNNTQNHRELPNPSVGQFRVLVFLMKFSDHANRQVPDKYEYQILWNLRIRAWIVQNSYGAYDAFFEVKDWFVSNNSEKHYSFGQSGRVAALQESFWPMLEQLDADPNWDWSRYDADGNKKLDNLIILHSGYAAEEGGSDCTNGREYLERIWSHAFSDSNGWKNSAKTIEVEGYMIASALDLTCDAIPSKMGVMTHEYLHTYYLIDLYDYTFEGKGVGRFDIMAYPYGFQNDGYIPGSLSVWAKQSIGWIDCPEQSGSGTVTLEPITSSAKGCLRIPLQGDITFGGAEYILLENRQQLGFDVDFWKSGVVIYHIDDLAREQYNRGFPGQGGWPGNGNHYQIGLLPADGKYDLEQGNNIGDSGDLWEVGMTLGPNNDGNTFPNTDMYQGGQISKSGITIEIKEAAGSNFKVKISQSRKSGPQNDNTDALNSIYSVPQPEEEPQSSSPTNPPTTTAITTTGESATEQFHTPDAEEFRMSGKLPQMPWYEEQVARAEKMPLMGQAPLAEEEDMGILVLDSLVDTSSSSSGAATAASIRIHWWVGFASLLVGLGAF